MHPQKEIAEPAKDLIRIACTRARPREIACQPTEVKETPVIRRLPRDTGVRILFPVHFDEVGFDLPLTASLEPLYTGIEGFLAGGGGAGS